MTDLPCGRSGRNVRGGRVTVLCEIGRSLTLQLSTVGPHIGAHGPTYDLAASPRTVVDRAARTHTEPIARRTGDPCLLEEGLRPGARAGRDSARRGACRPAGPAGAWPVHGHDRRSGPDGDDEPAGAQRGRRRADRRRPRRRRCRCAGRSTTRPTGRRARR